MSCNKRWWCNGQHWCLPSIRSGFDSRPSQIVFQISQTLRLLLLIFAYYLAMKGRVKYLLTAKLETLTTNENGKLCKKWTVPMCFDIYIYLWVKCTCKQKVTIEILFWLILESAIELSFVFWEFFRWGLWIHFWYF